MLGLLLHAQRDARGAIEHYEKAVELDPQTAASAANNLAWLYAESGENLDRALELAQIARTHLPADAEPLDTLGWVYMKKGVMSQAETFIRQAVDLDPNNAAVSLPSRRHLREEGRRCERARGAAARADPPAWQRDRAGCQAHPVHPRVLSDP